MRDLCDDREIIRVNDTLDAKLRLWRDADLTRRYRPRLSPPFVDCSLVHADLRLIGVPSSECHKFNVTVDRVELHVGSPIPRVFVIYDRRRPDLVDGRFEAAVRWEPDRPCRPILVWKALRLGRRVGLIKVVVRWSAVYGAGGVGPSSVAFTSTSALDALTKRVRSPLTTAFGVPSSDNRSVVAFDLRLGRYVGDEDATFSVNCVGGDDDWNERHGECFGNRFRLIDVRKHRGFFSLWILVLALIACVVCVGCCWCLCVKSACFGYGSLSRCYRRCRRPTRLFHLSWNETVEDEREATMKLVPNGGGWHREHYVPKTLYRRTGVGRGEGRLPEDGAAFFSEV